MPRIVADAIDAYVVRRVHSRLQFLLLLRRADSALGNTWQSIHGSVQPEETAVAAAERLLLVSTGIAGAEAFSADFINQVYDHTRDVIVLAPVFAFLVDASCEMTLSDQFVEHAWCEREEATERLLWSGQRWAVRHIDELIGPGGPDAEFYRIR
jgi:dihydroneopterin triphosphate diphosphatase